jgi:hypothetical protein
MRVNNGPAEIEANAQSSHPVNRMAREACAADNAMSLEEVRLKRKRDERTG